MTLSLVALSVGALDPAGLARFRGGVLGRPATGDGTTLVPDDDTRFDLRFLPADEPKTGQNRMHLDLTSTSLRDEQRTVDRALALGGRHIDVGQRGDEGHLVLGDPEGDEVCVIEPGNRFLADCGFVGALACDGSQRAGDLCSEALGWPLVWDQDQETAVRSPHGGPEITWGGPPLMPRTARDRLHLHVAPRDGAREAELDRLLALGATPAGAGHDGAVGLADPDGTPFCVLPARQPAVRRGCGGAAGTPAAGAPGPPAGPAGCPAPRRRGRWSPAGRGGGSPAGRPPTAGRWPAAG